MGFDSVEVDVHMYLAEQAKKAALADFIEDQMIRYKDEAVKRFYIISSPKFAEQVAATTAFGYREMLPEAVSIVDELGLEEKHIAALMQDDIYMGKIIECEKEEQIQDWLYASINY